MMRRPGWAGLAQFGQGDVHVLPTIERTEIVAGLEKIVVGLDDFIADLLVHFLGQLRRLGGQRKDVQQFRHVLRRLQALAAVPTSKARPGGPVSV